MLRGGSPLSVAVTVSMYSARSEWLRGDDERSSAVFGFKEKRSALGPGTKPELMMMYTEKYTPNIFVCLHVKLFIGINCECF